MRRLRALGLGTLIAFVFLAFAELFVGGMIGRPSLDRYTLFRLHGADGYTMIASVRDPVLLLEEASSLLMPDATLLWRLRPNLQLQADVLSLGAPRAWQVHTDATGFRLPSAPDATIFALGDSCTFGWGVEDGEAWPAQLSAILRQPVQNLGVPGYSILQGERLWAGRSGTVLLAFGANDGHKVPRSDGIWLSEGTPGFFRRFLAGLHLVQWGQHLVYPLYAQATALSAASLQDRVAPVDYGHAVEKFLSGGRRVILISVCSRDAYRQQLEQLASAHSVPLVHYEALGVGTLDGCHPTPAGHQRLAEVLATLWSPAE
jgi:GDSL-like Lipase/Acylhydrolase family